MIVKICGITNLDDARAAIEAGATALGFNFYPRSPRYIGEDEAARIIEQVPPGVWKVGVFVNDIPATAARLVDIVQLHGARTAPLPPRVRLWRAIPVGPDFNLDRLEGPAEAFLLDAPASAAQGGTGRTFDWSLARGAKRKVIIAGGLDENNVAEAIRQARPWGVDACSRLEISPGRKDHVRMARFIKAALSVQL